MLCRASAFLHELLSSSCCGQNRDYKCMLYTSVMHFLRPAIRSPKEGLTFRQGAFLGRIPNCQAKGNLVHKVSEVVNQVQVRACYSPAEVAKEVSERVNGPANSDDEAHGIERRLHVFVHFIVGPSHLPGLARKDFEENEGPAAHAPDKASNRWEERSLSRIAECEHCHGTEEQAEEHAVANVGLHRRWDQVELDHLQWDRDRPVDVAVENG